MILPAEHIRQFTGLEPGDCAAVAGPAGPAGQDRWEVDTRHPAWRASPREVIATTAPTQPSPIPIVPADELERRADICERCEFSGRVTRGPAWLVRCRKCSCAARPLAHGCPIQKHDLELPGWAGCCDPPLDRGE